MPFLDHLQWRFAAKSFDPNKTVSDTDLQAIKDSIRLTPTSFGLEPYHIKVITDPAILEKIKPVSWDQPQITTCSHLLVFCARTDIVTNRIDQYMEVASGGNAEIKAKLSGYRDMMVGGLKDRDLFRWATNQAYIALGFAMAACAELKIDSCPLEGFEPEKVDEILDLPAHLKSCVMLPIGYREADPERPKVRFPESDMFS